MANERGVASEAAAEKTIFISRAGADQEIAAVIGRILESAGYTVILQQWDFARANFMKKIHDALAGGGRVVAVLSPEYLVSPYCEAEWMNTLADDPLNEKRRLIVLRIGDCKPRGLLAGIDYVDLVPILDDRARLRDAVHDAVLTGRCNEPQTDASSHAADSESIYAVPSFTGREGESRTLDAALRETGVAVIHGLGGTGKSSVAREYAWQNRERYGIVWWIAAETETGIIDGLLRLGVQLDHKVDQVANRHAAARYVLTTVLCASRTDALIIFDNVENEEMLRTWWPPGSVHLIITSRSAAWSSDIRRIHLRSWLRDDAVRYLLNESGRDDVAEADAAAIAESLGGLPLALAHAAAYLKRRKNVTAASYLERVEHHLRNAPAGAEYPRAVFATFQAAIAEAERETPGAASIACLASFFAPDAIPEELFRQAIDLYPAELRPPLPDAASSPLDLRATITDRWRVEEAIGEFDQLSLVAFSPETRTFTMHRLVQAAARDLIGEEALAWIFCAVGVIQAAFPIPEYGTWAECERHLAHALMVLDWLPSDANFPGAIVLVDKCARYFRMRASFAEAEPLYRRSLHMVEMKYGPDHAGVETSLNNLALLLEETRGPSEAEPLYRRALEIVEARAGPESPDIAILLDNLARSLSEHEDPHGLVEAELLVRRAIAIAEANLEPNDPDIAVRLANLAGILQRTGRFDEAESSLRRALDIDEAKFGPNHPEVASDLNNIAIVLQETHRIEEAEIFSRRAVAISEAVYGTNPHPHVASMLRNLAVILSETGSFDEAERLLRRALAIDTAAYGRNHHVISADIACLAALLRGMGRAAEAAEIEARSAEE